MKIVYFLMLGVLHLASTCFSQPITPAEYRDLIKQGFTTNWFKTSSPLSKYDPKNIQDIYDKGFRNVRLRSRADLYDAPYNDTSFTSFLDDLSTVVDRCLEVGVIPIISWVHHEAEAYATDEDFKNYITWWTEVAKKMKNKHHKLSFNLFTELGTDTCGNNCGESLRKNKGKYNRWTREVIEAIRQTGSNNADRILILGSPGKTADHLHKIDTDITSSDDYLMVEWHIYASGPNKKLEGLKYWIGDHDPVSRENVENAFIPARNFTAERGILTYFGAWMPMDLAKGSENQSEVINFARYFTIQMKNESIPWSLNVLDRFYDPKKSKWLTYQTIAGQTLNMAEILDNILQVM